MNWRLILLIYTLKVFLISDYLFAQDATWRIQDGWVLKKENQQREYEKFFAIGLWGIPGYSFKKLSVKEEKLAYPLNYSMYKNKIKYFNLFYLQSGYGKEYMNDVVKMGGSAEFSWFLEKEYYNNSDKVNASYLMMRKIEKNTNTLQFKKLIKKSIDLTINEAKRTSSDFIWAPFDEIASGFQYWCWPKKATDFVYSEIKRITPKKLVYVDLLGSDGGEGNSFLFEQYYKKKFGQLPQDLPFYAIYKSNKTDNSPLNFHFNHKGHSNFEYKNGVRSKKQLDLQTYINDWYENVKLTANGYKNSGDIFGVNSYSVFYENPELVGYTVDAIKAGIRQDTPVWMFFDSNGYGKPANVSVADYLKNLKCQIYTSIVHGATGALFWSDLTTNDLIFNDLIPIIEDLRKNENIFLYRTVEKKLIGDIQYMIKENSEKERYLIAVNTNKMDVIYFTNSFSNKTIYQPLEVYSGKL